MEKNLAENEGCWERQLLLLTGLEGIMNKVISEPRTEGRVPCDT